MNHVKALLKELKPLIDKLFKTCQIEKPIKFTLPFVLKGHFGVRPFAKNDLTGRTEIEVKDFDKVIQVLVEEEGIVDYLNQKEQSMLIGKSKIISDRIAETRKVEKEIRAYIKDYGKRNKLSRLDRSDLENDILFEIEGLFDNKYGW